MLRRRRHQKLRRVLNGKRFQLLLIAMRQYQLEHADAPVSSDDEFSVALRLLSRFARNVRRRSRRAADLSSTKLHRLRISTKRLRYLAEFMAPLYKRDRGRRYLARLAAVQKTLGDLNDLEVGRRLVKSLAVETPASHHVTCDWYEPRARAAELKLRDQLHDKLKRLRGTALPWK